jgi:hypothetical protein
VLVKRTIFETKPAKRSLAVYIFFIQFRETGKDISPVGGGRIPLQHDIRPSAGRRGEILAAGCIKKIYAYKQGCELETRNWKLETGNFEYAQRR